MSRKRKRQSRRRGVEPVDIQVRGAGPDAVEEFFRFGGSSVFPCGCSAHDAVQISIDDAGSAAYPMGSGLDRSDFEGFREAIGNEPLIWWHHCPKNENISVRSLSLPSPAPTSQPATNTEGSTPKTRHVVRHCPANASNAPLLATSRGHDRLRPPPAGVVGGRGGAVRDAAGAVGGSDRADGVMLRGVGPQTGHGPRRGRQVARDR